MGTLTDYVKEQGFRTTLTDYSLMIIVTCIWQLK